MSEIRYETEEAFSDLAKELPLKRDPLRDPHTAETCRITKRKVKWALLQTPGSPYPQSFHQKSQLLYGSMNFVSIQT